MADGVWDNVEGGCTCRAIRYRMLAQPMFVHCCHCSWCQRETGSAFALNALIEMDHIELLNGAPEAVPVPSASGKGQTILRCPSCRVALWSHYAGAGAKIAFLRVGTLDHPDRIPPDIHIFTETRQPWLQIPNDARQCPAYYDPRQEWPAESQARFRALRN